MRAAVLATLALLLAGCGFHWRGAEPPAEEHAVVALREAGRSPIDTWYGGGRDELRRVVTRALDQVGVLVVDEAPLVIELLGEQVRRRTAAIGATSVVAEYQLDYELRYRILDAAGAEITPPQRILRDTSYRFDENAVMGSAEEEALLRREMREDAARQLARQYRRRIAAQAVADPAPPANTEANDGSATAP